MRGALVAAALAACGPQVDDPHASDTESDPTTSTGTNPTDPTAPSATNPTSPTGPTDPSDTNGDTTGEPPTGTVAAVDILLVVDNSGSMGEEQARLAASIGSLVAGLDAAGADYRVGITTTDNGNPWCNGTGPEGGRLVATSCRSRTQDFVFAGAQMVDATQEACLDVCPEEWANIAISPTSTAGDPQARPRPWIESIGGATNLPPGLSVTQALQCMVPQGINGCGFEEHLESMYKAIVRSETDGEESQGFHRPGVPLMVLMFTDEADCSLNKAHETIFLPDGDRTFWSDPTTGAPTSAVCWNAGVECLGGMCSSIDLDPQGNPVPSDLADDDASLRPVSRYLARLDEVEANDQALNPGSRVFFALIAGVGSDGTPVYQQGIDPQFELDFGIGPGCESPTTRAVPPVRNFELSNQFRIGDDRNTFSICDDDLGPALESLTATVASTFP